MRYEVILVSALAGGNLAAGCLQVWSAPLNFGVALFCSLMVLCICTSRIVDAVNARAALGKKGG